MRFLLSTIGSRGDVQPLAALAHQLRLLGQQVRVCAPPDFGDWLAALGMEVVPLGPSLRPTAKGAPAQDRRTLMEGTVAEQFSVLERAARGCDVMVGATALQVAAPSVAEHLGLPYVFIAYSPTVLPSRHHPPPLLTSLGDVPPPETADYTPLWEEDARRWNLGWAELLNARRAALGLAPVADVRGHVLTAEPWLAADPVLAPFPEAFQPGAFLLPDSRSLPEELEAYLAAGEQPIYFGFGSLRAPEGMVEQMVAAARAVGRRALLSRGWAELSSPDCFLVDDVNHQALFPRVAAAVHHGGAGTTTAAARAGVPQVLVPQGYDQPYWAGRVEALGIGRKGDELAASLEAALRPEVAERARSVAERMTGDGARIAAERLVAGAPEHRCAKQ